MEKFLLASLSAIYIYFV